MTVDTLEYAKSLERAGVDRKAAEAHATALRDAISAGLVTKNDLDAAVARIEMAMWKHTVGVLLGVLALGGLLIRFVST